MKKIFSGVQPSGVIHLGNYLGAIKNWVGLQEGYDCKFSVVDLHAITTTQDPKKLKENIYNTLAILLSCGIDPKKNPIFLQSQVSAHTELMWILNTIAYTGELDRMTQFKDKSQKIGNETINMGLLDYPVLMAADVLLYDTDLVPVGEDQLQHLELTRTLAKRFNNRFGDTFKVPGGIVNKEGARIMGLDNPEKKMSKSAASEYNYIALTDDADTIRKKISRSVTDSQTSIEFNQERKGLYNLLTVYKLVSGQSEEEITKHFSGKGYKELKEDLANLIIEHLTPIREKYTKLIIDKTYLDKVFAEGRSKVEPMAESKIKEVKEKMGFLV